MTKRIARKAPKWVLDSVTRHIENAGGPTAIERITGVLNPTPWRLSRQEIENPSIDLLLTIATKLEISVDELIGYTPPTVPSLQLDPDLAHQVLDTIGKMDEEMGLDLTSRDIATMFVSLYPVAVRKGSLDSNTSLEHLSLIPRQTDS